MRNKIIPLLILSSLAISCSTHPKEPEVKVAPALEQAQNDTAKTQKPMIALASDKDPVCGMPMTEADMVGDTTLYEGKVYGFCSIDCKNDFLKNPKEYIK